MPKMPSSELKAMLSSERADALAAVSASKLSSERSDAMDYYLGDMSRDMPAADGRSRAVSTDVADTIEGLMPSLMEIFTAGDEVVKFEPVGPEDVKAAEQETDYVNHVFMQVNSGFLILYSFIKDALLSKNGIVKVWWEDKTVEERETYYDLPDDGFAILSADPDIEITAHSKHPAPQPGAPVGQGPPEQPEPGEGGPPAPMFHDVECVRSKSAANVKIEPVPPEEFGISRTARNIPDCDYCFHEVIISHAKLIAQGYDKAQVEALTPYVGITNTEELQRDTVDEARGVGGGDNTNLAAQKYEVTEHYVRMDYDGTGKACLYQVTTAGSAGDILKKSGKEDIRPIDAIPFAAMTPVIVTHRFFGRSIADLVMDIQRIKTALLRSMLDNAYLANNPRVEVAEQFASSETLDDLLVSRPGGIVRTKQPGGLNWQTVPNISAGVFPMLEYMDSSREMRTGVTRQGQGIDADALMNQSATAVNQTFSATQARMRLIARIFAETGIRDLFSLVHATIRKHGEQAATVRLRNQWVTVDPREWKSRNDMTIHVGLGTGGKQEQMGVATTILNVQKEMIAGGMSNVANQKNVYNAAVALVKAAGHKDADQYFSDPSAVGPDGKPLNPPPPAPPNPDMIKAQAQQQQADAQQQLAQAKAAADVAVQNNKTQAEAALAQQKFEHDKQMALLNHGLETQKTHQQIAHNDAIHQQAMFGMAADHARAEREHQLKMETISAAAQAKVHPPQEGKSV